MAQKSPLARVKEEFGGKDKLVDKIVGLLGSGDEPKDDMRRRLLGAANSKLVRLHGVATKVKELGGKDELATATAVELGRAKDKDYVVKLGSFSSGRLIDILQAAKRRNQRKQGSSTGATTSTASTSAKAAPASAPAGGGSAAAAKSKRAPVKKAKNDKNDKSAKHATKTAKHAKKA
jgi:cell division septation protein DedD